MHFDHLIPLYDRLPLSITHGQGVWVWDQAGDRYLDATSGLGVNALGHAHPQLIPFLQQQAQKLIHIGNGLEIPEQEQLAAQLCAHSGMEKVCFGNSGAEANEAALKLARLYGHGRGIEAPEVIVFEQAFHGRTLATLSANGNYKTQEGFEPLVGGFIRAPFNDLSALESIAIRHPQVVAVLIEPIQGNGGIRMPDPLYLASLRQLCDRHQWLLICDEIQSGIGRTGAFFAYQHHAAQPDIVTVAKALGNGIPISACLTRGASSHLFSIGRHGTTFGGNPFACAVASRVLDIIEQEALIVRVHRSGIQFLDALKSLATRFEPLIQEVRGQGFMIGIELRQSYLEQADISAKQVLLLASQQGLLLNITAQKTIRLLPPLISQDTELEFLLARLETLFSYLLNSSKKLV